MKSNTCTGDQNVMNLTSDKADQEQPLSDGVYLAMGVYLTLLGVISALGNITVLAVMLSRRKRPQKLQNLLLYNLAIADLLVTLTGYPMTAISNFYKRWIFGDLGCEVGGFIVFFLSMVSMNTLTFIAALRFIFVCKPAYHHLLRVAVARPVILVSWLHALIWTVLPLFGWNGYVPEPFLTACSLDWAGASRDGFTYVAMTLVTCFALHLAVIVYSYIHIVFKTKKLTFGVNRSNLTVKLEEVLWQQKVQTERGVTKMCFVMIGAYLLCWTPYTIFSFLVMIGVQLSTAVTTLPTLFAKMSCALNPIIYAFMSSNFRNTFFSLLPWHRLHQNRVTMTEFEITSGRNKTTQPSLVTKYTGDITSSGVYIGNAAVTITAPSSDIF